MTRSVTTYTVAFVVTMVLVVAAWGISIFVLNGEEGIDVSEGGLSAVVLLSAFGLPGAFVVATFVSRPSWRRRALYVTRLGRDGLVSLVAVFPAWLLGMAAVALALQVLAGDDSADKVDDAGLGAEETERAPSSDQTLDDETASDDTATGDARADRTLVNDDTEAGEHAGSQPAADGAEVDEPSGSVPYADLVNNLAAVGMMLAVILALRWCGLDVWRHLGFKTGRFWRHVGIGLVAYLVFTWTVYPVLKTVFEALLPLFGESAQAHPAFEEYSQTHSIVARVGILVGISIQAPLLEEVIFRGVVFQMVKRYGGSIVAILASAALFAAAHVPLFVALNIFFLGVLFAYLFDRTGSIVPAIALHFFFNAQGALAMLLGG